MDLSFLYPQEPSVNDPGQNLGHHLFVISDKFFGQNDDLCPNLSTCLFHRFEVWDLQSKLKYIFSNEKISQLKRTVRFRELNVLIIQNVSIFWPSD